MEIGKELEVKDLIKVAIENIDQSINQTRSEPSTIDENIAQYDDTKGVTHSCNECQYKTGYKSTLRRHKQSKHEDVMYSCSECEYKTGQKFNLRTHKLSKHECVKYSCDECEYNTGQKFHLIRGYKLIT